LLLVFEKQKQHRAMVVHIALGVVLKRIRILLLFAWRTKTAPSNGSSHCSGRGTRPI